MNKIEKTETLSKILANRKFSVDVFQREYRWGQKQIEQMLNDFQGTFEEYYDPNNYDTTDAFYDMLLQAVDECFVLGEEDKHDKTCNDRRCIQDCRDIHFYQAHEL